MGLFTPSRRVSLTDGLRSMKLDPIGEVAELARYIGHWEPSHEALDADRAIQTGVRIAVLAVAEAVRDRRAGQFPPIVTGHDAPRPIWRDG